MLHKLKVTGIGCCLVDILYNGIDFSSDIIRPYLSKKRGDGGLTPGKLVFREEFEQFCGITFDEVTKIITGGRPHDKINLGGPSIVSLVHLAQITDREHCEVRFYGRGGKDEPGHHLLGLLKKTPVVLGDYRLIDNHTPSTIVLSDPEYHNGEGERMFINSIGAAREFSPSELDEEFFNSDIVVFGGTALVPQIHDDLTALLKRARSKGCLNIVNTVFDFRNEKAAPLHRWPLGESDDSYGYTDLLITDLEEALRLSGTNDQDSAARFFIEKKTPSFIITNGSQEIIAYSDGKFFRKKGFIKMPVSRRITEELKNYKGGDTTGCGDNFAGGVIASIVNQLSAGIKHPDITEACCRGIVSGGFTCFYMGGTYFEEKRGEKLERIEPYYESYKEQIRKD